MPNSYIVKRGDSLWSLACRYLGHGTRWPEIYKEHNKAAANSRPHSPLMPIKNENIIFVGQKIIIPPRKKIPQPGTGTKPIGNQMAVPLNTKVTYSIGRDTPPVLYGQTLPDYTVKTEISGELGIEIVSHDGHQHSLELLMSKDTIQAKQKLRDAYDPAVAALTARPEMVFESGKVKIKSPIAANANIGPYSITVQAENPMKMSGTLKPSTIDGTLEIGRRKYKYTADIELKAEVYWHPRNRAKAEVPVMAPQHQPQMANGVGTRETSFTDELKEAAKTTGEIVAKVGFVAFLAVTAILFSNAYADEPKPIEPFTHTINRDRLKK